MDICEIAASAAGDQDFLSETVRMFEDCNTSSALARLDCAHQTGGTAAKNQRVESLDHAGHM